MTTDECLDALAADGKLIKRPLVLASGVALAGFREPAWSEALAPWIGHIHFSDSTGMPATFPTGSRNEQHFFGVGDMHAPKGYGRVDFDALAAALTMRDDTRVVIEIKSNFIAHTEVETLATAQAFAAAVNAKAAS